MAEAPVLKYDERQIRGILRMNWMLKPVTALKCKVELSTLEAAELPWYESGKEDLSSSIMNILELFEIPFREDYHAFIVYTYTSTTIFSNRSLFGGLVSEGLIVIENMFRVNGGAHISDMALAMYRNFYAIDELKQILVCNITNDDTVQFVMDNLYTEQNNLHFGGRYGIQNWPYPTPEYLALLSTPVSAVAVNVVLGAWPRGTHYISNIQTCVGSRNRNQEINFMLQIDKIPADLTKMPKLAKETKAALLDAMGLEPGLLDSESSKASNSGKASESGESGESKKRKPDQPEEAEGSEPAAKKKKKTEESEKRKTGESKEAAEGGAAKKTKTEKLKKPSRIAKKAEKEAEYDSELDAEGETDPEFEPAPSFRTK